MKWGRRKPAPGVLLSTERGGSWGSVREECRLRRDAGWEMDPLAPWEGCARCADVQAPRFAPVYCFLVVGLGEAGGGQVTPADR